MSLFPLGVLKVAGLVAVGVVVGLQLAKRGATRAALPSPPRTFGKVIRLVPEQYATYRRLHAAVWPDVLRRIYMSNIRNFNIYYHPGLGLLFMHFEYVGNDYDGDMAAIGRDPTTLQWWAECEPCQQPLQWSGPVPSQGGSGDWWAPMECVFQCGALPMSYATPPGRLEQRTLAGANQ